MSVPVTKSFLPPIAAYTNILQSVWDTQQLTNGGALLLKLIDELKAYLAVSHLLPIANGTLALQVAVKALNLSGEIITTPFSYIATSAAVVWQGCKPVFVDIEPEHWCIDAGKIEAAITPNTCAILATHVFGNTCDVEKITAIADRYGLKVIYDGAHCFGVKYWGKSIFNHGDVSVCSFHATKLFHTAEGGCVVTQDPQLLDKMLWMHNHGHNGQEDFYGIGINGKVSELQAALGLSILPYIAMLIEKRKERVVMYDSLLSDKNVQRIKIREGTDWNYGYYPIVFETDATMLAVKKSLNEQDIFPRRYFYPSLNKVAYLKGQEMPVAESIASRILCLPLYHDLELENVERIASIINQLI